MTYDAYVTQPSTLHMIHTIQPSTLQMIHSTTTIDRLDTTKVNLHRHKGLDTTKVNLHRHKGLDTTKVNLHRHKGLDTTKVNLHRHKGLDTTKVNLHLHRHKGLDTTKVNLHRHKGLDTTKVNLHRHKGLDTTKVNLHRHKGLDTTKVNLHRHKGLDTTKVNLHRHKGLDTTKVNLHRHKGLDTTKVNLHRHKGLDTTKVNLHRHKGLDTTKVNLHRHKGLDTTKVNLHRHKGLDTTKVNLHRHKGLDTTKVNLHRHKGLDTTRLTYIVTKGLDTTKVNLHRHKGLDTTKVNLHRHKGLDTTKVNLHRHKGLDTTKVNLHLHRHKGLDTTKVNLHRHKGLDTTKVNLHRHKGLDTTKVNLHRHKGLDTTKVNLHRHKGLDTTKVNLHRHKGLDTTKVNLHRHKGLDTTKVNLHRHKGLDTTKVNLHLHRHKGLDTTKVNLHRHKGLDTTKVNLHRHKGLDTTKVNLHRHKGLDTTKVNLHRHKGLDTTKVNLHRHKGLDTTKVNLHRHKGLDTTKVNLHRHKGLDTTKVNLHRHKGGYTIFHLYFGPGYMVYVHKNIQASCIIPEVNPYDKEIMKFFWKPDPIVCSKDSDLVYFDFNSTLHLNKSRTRSSSISCHYQEVVRKTNDDFNVALGPEVWFNSSVVVRTDFVNVKCFIGGKIIYSRLHYQVYRPPDQEKRNPKRKYSVLIFGMDSVSRLAAIRELPKTMSYLENNLGAYVFKGYTKLGDNTLPNLAPLITGHYAFSKEFPVVEHTKFDNHPFIWHNVSSLGGTTMFLEDWPRISTFNLGTSGGGGFLKPPTNHYMRPFYLAINHMQMFESPVSDVLQFLEDKNVKLSSTSYLCYGEKSLHVIAIDYFKRFLRAYKDDLKFTLVWNNKLMTMDPVLIKSETLRLEDSKKGLPLISLVVPQELKKAYPNLHENLKTNINRLTSPFDAYETIVDILNENFKSQEVAVPYPRGISLFRPIPNDRSCADAGIDEHNCVCYSSDSVDVKSLVVVKLAEYVTANINKQIPQDKCAKLSLKKIQYAKRIHSQLSYDASNQNKKPWLYMFYKPKEDLRERYQVSFDVYPSNALFEVTVESYGQNQFAVLGDISRTNTYGNQSACMTKTELRKYCYCV
ncbi:unnamed protein product [Mytilus edulis]|uniref:Uncharacterized protein n=1 Tax=Mytilus edulis TaxID=6550 RepID=A0A8S3TUY7_MYTED|nr:unnamed protein product [Mytilus edulis]